jgi:hypothetical protein
MIRAMEITGLGWCGTRTAQGAELAAFYENVLGLQPAITEPGFWVFRLPNGRNVEVFALDCPGKEHFDTGPDLATVPGTRRQRL